MDDSEIATADGPFVYIQTGDPDMPHRRALTPGALVAGTWTQTSISAESDAVKAVCGDAWTTDVVAAWRARCQADAPTADDFWRMLRTRRDGLLAACDYTQLPDVPDGDTKTAWATYRQALRDLPEHTTDPASPSWPAVPAG